VPLYRKGSTATWLIAAVTPLPGGARGVSRSAAASSSALGAHAGRRRITFSSSRTESVPSPVTAAARAMAQVANQQQSRTKPYRITYASHVHTSACANLVLWCDADAVPYIGLHCNTGACHAIMFGQLLASMYAYACCCDTHPRRKVCLALTSCEPWPALCPAL
jgi:hypothetical protein